MKHKFKEFKPTSWSIDNKTSIFVLTIILSIFGMIAYNSIPKEQFPELVIPTMFVSTPYPGTSPEDIENLVTRPIEKNIKSINGVKKITSHSIQDFSVITVEFNTNVDVAVAKQKVKDAVDKSKKDLPNDLPADPNVMEIDFSEMPIMYLNISGDFELDKLKQYSEVIQDRIESLKEITRVDIVGALDREIQINLDIFKMQAASVSFSDVERVVAYENMTISGGAIDVQNMKRSIRVVGEIKDIEIIKNIVLKSSSGALVYLKYIAEVKDDFKERESYARLDGKNVITLNIVKKSGENLLVASSKIKNILTDLQAKTFPAKLKITITGDQSKHTENTLNELNNTIIIGFILVTIVLMFFMGFTNAFFVGMAAPLSMFLAYLVMPSIGFTMNMLVMFSFIFALGIVVDDAIVVIENIHRIYNTKGLTIVNAAKMAAGEVFIPILSGTLTTIAPFLPLAFWPGIVGKFMYFIPITLIITLFASLVVAYIINPVFAVSFMKHDDHETKVNINKKQIMIISFVFIGLALILYVSDYFGVANFVVLCWLIYLFFQFVMNKVIMKFQFTFIPALMNKYEKLLRFIIRGKNAYYALASVIALLILTFVIVAIKPPKVVFFPGNDPNYIYVYIKLPVGTHLNYTDSISRVIEKRVVNVVGNNNPIVESIITNVALGASDPYDNDRTTVSNKAKVSVAFVEFSKRNGCSTVDYLDKIREAVKGISGAEITVEQNKGGPPTGKPINLEVSSDNMDDLVYASNDVKKYIESLKISGIEELKSDFDDNKPEIIINVDRVKANREGISTAQVGSEIRTAVFGKEVSKFKINEDEYPIQVRYLPEQRNDINTLMNSKITFRDMNTGLLKQIPISAIAKVEYNETYGGIKRKNLKRVITISSNVLTGYTPNEIIKQINNGLKNYKIKEGVDIKFTGEQEDQQENVSFLSMAMLLSLCLIIFILITQFNSLGKPLIIVSEVLFSLIGVLLGFVFFNITISIIMTGMGLVALAGIVVRNGILLVEFTDVLLARGYKTRDAIVIAGKTRITPVLLTATATILGLIPLAIGFNINFVTLFTELNPNIHFGGDNVAFFGPLAWTIIFGLSFATFLTLLLIPAMYFIMYGGKIKYNRFKNRVSKHLS